MHQGTLKLNRISTVFALLSAQAAFSANFNITPYGRLPTNVTSGQSVSAYYTVTNKTGATQNGYTIQGLPKTVTQNTTPPNCGNPINLGPNEPLASCQLQFDITGAVSSNFAICKGNSCTTASVPLNVSVDSAPILPTARYLYITQYDSESVVVCTLNADGSFSSGDCNNADPNDSLNGVDPQGIVVNKAGTIAYIQGYETSAVYQCPIDPTSGLFSLGCTSTSISLTNPYYYYPQYGMLDLDSNNEYAYLSNNNDGGAGFNIQRCPIDPITKDIQDNCLGSEQFGSPYGAGIVVNKANTKVYAALYNDPKLLSCPVSSWGTGCSMIDGVTINGTNIPFLSVAGLAFNFDNSTLYIAEYTIPYRVYGCNPENISGGYFSSCFIATEVGGGDYAWGITINSKIQSLILVIIATVFIIVIWNQMVVFHSRIVLE